MSLLRTSATTAISAGLIVVDLFDAVSRYLKQDTERYEFLWRWSTEKSDAAHQIAWTAEHPPNTVAKLQVDDWVGSSVYNGFLVSFSKQTATVASAGLAGGAMDADLYDAAGDALPSRGRGANGKGPDAGEGNGPKNPRAAPSLPKPGTLSRNQREQLGFRKVSTEEFRERFPQRGQRVSEDSQQWLVTDYPTTITDANKRLNVELLREQRRERRRETAGSRGRGNSR